MPHVMEMSRQKVPPPPPFQSYLDDLNSSTNCCRSASLLVPASNANDILQTLRSKNWMCQVVLTRPWREKATCADKTQVHDHDRDFQDDSWYYQCLPSEDELTFLNTKYELSYLLSSSPASLQTQIVKYHMQSKSLLVPLTDDATEFLLRAWFEEGSYAGDKKGYKLVCNWLQCGIIIIHNYDGNQTVSLSKEVDCFPESVKTVGGGMQSDHAFTFADLFAGIGGFRLGLESLGGKCIGSCEIDAYARETYHNNFLDGNEDICEEFFVNDIARLEILPSTVDVLCGGFPCQSFSTMASFPSSPDGRDCKTSTDVSTHRQGGLLTPAKGKLFFHLLRILRKAQPKMFIFENVKGLMSLDKGSHFKLIVDLLEESGYSVTHGVVDAAWLLPQRRERVYFVGIRRDLFECSDGSSPYVAFTSEELKEKYQIYDNDLDNSVDKYARLLQRLGLRNDESEAKKNLSTSKIGDILDADAKIPSHCFLTMHQWTKIQSQTYQQLHNDGAGQLITEDEPCSQTLLSSYRQSYLLHSQFIVSNDNSYLAHQEETLKSVALTKTNSESTEGECVGVQTKVEEQQLPRFFSPREW